MTTLTDYAHSLGLAMFGKNPDDTGDSYAADMLDVFDGVITEQCNEHSTCSLLDGYLAQASRYWTQNTNPLHFPVSVPTTMRTALRARSLTPTWLAALQRTV